MLLLTLVSIASGSVCSDLLEGMRHDFTLLRSFDSERDHLQQRLLKSASRLDMAPTDVEIKTKYEHDMNARNQLALSMKDTGVALKDKLILLQVCSKGTPIQHHTDAAVSELHELHSKTRAQMRPGLSNIEYVQLGFHAMQVIDSIFDRLFENTSSITITV